MDTTNLIQVIVLALQLLTNTVATNATGVSPALEDGSRAPLQQLITLEHGLATLAFKLPDGRIARVPQALPFLLGFSTNYAIGRSANLNGSGARAASAEPSPRDGSHQESLSLNPAFTRVPTRPAPPVPRGPVPDPGPPLPPGLK
jgi:hypothetical protein